MGNTSNLPDEVYVNDRLHTLKTLGTNRGPLPDSARQQIRNMVTYSSFRGKLLVIELSKMQNRNNAEQYAYDLLRFKLR